MAQAAETMALINLAIDRTAKHLYDRIRKPFTWEGSPPISERARNEWRDHIRSAVEAGLIELVLPKIERPMTGQLTSEMMLCDHEFKAGMATCLHCGVSYEMLFGRLDGE